VERRVFATKSVLTGMLGSDERHFDNSEAGQGARMRGLLKGFAVCGTADPGMPVLLGVPCTLLEYARAALLKLGRS